MPTVTRPASQQYQLLTPRGISIPFRFDSTGYPAPDVGLSATIQDSIFTILSTVVGERVHRPTFGSYLTTFVFEPLTNANALRAVSEIRRAIAVWEPRATINEVTFDINGTQLNIHITWTANGAIQGATDIPVTVQGISS